MCSLRYCKLHSNIQYTAICRTVGSIQDIYHFLNRHCKLCCSTHILENVLQYSCNAVLCVLQYFPEGAGKLRTASWGRGTLLRYLGNQFVLIFDQKHELEIKILSIKTSCFCLRLISSTCTWRTAGTNQTPVYWSSSTAWDSSRWRHNNTRLRSV